MIVHAPVKTVEKEQVCVAARFEMQKPIAYLPSSLWYRFPEGIADRINARADAFAPTALLVAMYAGEDLRICGEISPQLAYHLYEYLEVYHSWFPKLFKRVKIQYEQFAEPVPHREERVVGTAFSGGVDSFYTLWAHIRQNQPILSAQVTHGLFVHGLDLRLDDKKNYQTTADVYDEVFRELGLELIQASTNAYQFSEFRINWTMFFGAPLIGAALLLGPWMQRFYVPSGMPSYTRLFPQGSSPLIDHLLSTESTEIVHHGSALSRHEKTSAVSAWTASHHKLRVCADKMRMHGVVNCCSCHKCYRTMVLLELNESLFYYNNFPRRMTFVDFIRWGALMPLNPDIESGIRNLAFRKGYIWIGFWMQIAILVYGIQKTVNYVVKSLLSREQLFRLKRKVFNPESRENIQ